MESSIYLSADTTAAETKVFSRTGRVRATKRAVIASGIVRVRCVEIGNGIICVGVQTRVRPVRPVSVFYSLISTIPHKLYINKLYWFFLIKPTTISVVFFFLSSYLYIFLVQNSNGYNIYSSSPQYTDYRYYLRKIVLSVTVTSTEYLKDNKKKKKKND